MATVELYDTTLRDGSQGEGVSFSVADKLRVAERLDAIGIHYIEGGWPGSNPKDIQFFREARNLGLKRAKLAAFGCTRRPRFKAEDEPLLAQLLDSEAPVITIFGKSWTLHVEEVLRTDRETNLEMIRDSVRFLKAHRSEVIYDAEQFFDGFAADADYALATLRAAAEGGADRIVLCDTNGGRLPGEIGEAVRHVCSLFDTPIGIHTHNDSGLGVATTLAGVEAGATQVQATMNGYGERTGNANLCTIIPVLKLKMGIDCVSDEDLKLLRQASAFIDEVANVPPDERRPFVGRNAFTHKAGMHVDGVLKNPRTFEHVDPAVLGAERRFLISELSGSGTIALKAAEFGIDLEKKSPETRQILAELTRLEHEGYSFEDAEASFQLLMRKLTGRFTPLFDLIGYRVIVERRGGDGDPITEATLKVSVGGEQLLTVAEGGGPVEALDGALRRALGHFYPELRLMRLTDYKVRVVDAKEGTAARVRVWVESADDRGSWSTIGVSTNVMEASWQALADSVEYFLLRRQAK